jgi:chorismate dehydratase
MADNRDMSVRIGMVHYINCAPIHEVWKSRSHDPSWQLIEEHPAALNRMLAAGDIELGFVSSHEYGIRPGQYRLLADLSISANGPVGSVFLFSRVKPEKLSGLTVLLSAQSKTSVCLARIILAEFFNVNPTYISGDIKDSRKLGAEAILAIGDDALRLKIDGSYQYCLDLGEAWQVHTGLPFVFGVCAVREDFYTRNPELVEDVHRELLSCRDEGVDNLKSICSLAAPKIPMEVDACHSYLRAIEFNLDERKKKALATFFSYLMPMDEASVTALPLKIILPG